MENKKEKTKQRSKYNMLQNSFYMLKQIWKPGSRSVPFFCILLAALGVANNLIDLFIAPVILGKVEAYAPLKELLFTIFGFAGALLLCRGIKAYCENIVFLYRLRGRLRLLNDVHYKFCVTAYPNTEDPEILKRCEKSVQALSDNNASTEAIWDTLTDLIRDVASFCIYLLILSSLNPFLLIIILATSIAGYLVNKRINEWGYRHREEEADYEKKMSYANTKAEDVKLAKDIRVFGMQGWLEDLYRTNLRLYRAFVKRRESVYLWANAIDAALAFLRNGIAYFYLIFLVLKQGLTASEFLLYFTAVSSFTTWVTGILEQLSTLHKQSLDISIIREFLESSEQFRFEDGDTIGADSAPSFEIRFDHVSFRYPGAEKDTIHDLSFILSAGEKLAVVGLNGAGKTTLVKLLCGLYDPTEGKVLLNGKDIREFNRQAYYRLFSAVFQDFSLLESTLRENVAQTVSGADEAKIRDCLDKAGLLEKVASMPHGLDTHIGRRVYEDGIELSGGETQRLMLARALYKDGAILVLDEPTAALDPISENDIYMKYNEMTHGRTSLFISHRLASTRFCDRILFLENGAVAEEGSHDALMEANGKYAELFHVQSKYYQNQPAELI